jgi:hypothetical protein
MFSILRKHAVWCQCANILFIVLSIASWASVQSMTFGIDMFWSVFLTLHAIVIFCAAEHESVFYFSRHSWQAMDEVRVNTIVGAQFACMFVDSVSIRMFIVVALTFVQTKIRCHICYFAMNILAGLHSWSLLALTMIDSYLFYQLSTKKNKLTGQKHTMLRPIYKIKSLCILISGLQLWVLRCEERFPHKFRWYPIIIGVLAIGVGVLHCSYYVAETFTSNNYILGRSSHLVAASLNAARKCPECKQCLSTLDMESRF